MPASTSRTLPCFVSLLMMLAPLPLLAQGAGGLPSRPPGVTDSAVAWGRQLFHGSANCSGCHGRNGDGTRLAPALTGRQWRHGPGTYRWLVAHIKAGVPAHRSITEVPMPMRGWDGMPDADVEAVAAYVWSITHPPRSAPRVRGRS